MSILILGASGQIGGFCVQDLIEFCGEKDIIASSRKMSNVKKAMDDLKLTKKLKLMELDANDTGKVLETIKREKVESVVNCAWYQTNLGVMDACLKGGATYTDLGGFFDTCLKQLELHKKWKDAGINATIGLGSTPGMTNCRGSGGCQEARLGRCHRHRMRLGQHAPCQRGRMAWIFHQDCPRRVHAGIRSMD